MNKPQQRRKKPELSKVQFLIRTKEESSSCRSRAEGHLRNQKRTGQSLDEGRNYCRVGRLPHRGWALVVDGLCAIAASPKQGKPGDTGPAGRLTKGRKKARQLSSDTRLGVTIRRETSEIRVSIMSASNLDGEESETSDGASFFAIVFRLKARAAHTVG